MATTVRTSHASVFARFDPYRPGVEAWGSGLVVAAALLGPALAPGALASLDLILTPTIPFPDALLGGGIELPRRVPLAAPLSWVSLLIGGPTAGKLLLLVSLTAAFAGVVRLASSAPLPARLTAGLVYAAGPFAMTRVSAGHWTIVAAMAVLPFALPRLLEPARDPARTFLWMTALAVTGVFGGLVGAAVAFVGLAFERSRRAWTVVGLAALAQLPWLGPALLVRGGGMDLVGGEPFATRAEGPLGVVGGLLAQHGFWRGASQVGGTAGPGLVLVGLGVAALAAYGSQDLPRRWRRPLGVLAALGLAAAAAPGIPGLDALHARLTDWEPLAPFRESQRTLVLFLAWAAPSAALGAARLARSEPRLRWGALAFPLAAAVALAVPGIGGAEGRLRTVEFPAGWSAVDRALEGEPGTVLALPWHQYLNLGFADGRRVLNPLPDFLGGDVVSSHDPELTRAPRQESIDSRESRVRAILPDPSAAALADLGVRWVVLAHEADWRHYALDAPGIAAILRTRSVDLYEVEAWHGSPGVVRPAWKTATTLLATAATVIGVLVAFRRRRPVAS